MFLPRKTEGITVPQNSTLHSITSTQNQVIFTLMTLKLTQTLSLAVNTLVAPSKLTGKSDLVLPPTSSNLYKETTQKLNVL